MLKLRKTGLHANHIYIMGLQTRAPKARLKDTELGSFDQEKNAKITKPYFSSTENKLFSFESWLDKKGPLKITQVDMPLLRGHCLH